MNIAGSHAEAGDGREQVNGHVGTERLDTESNDKGQRKAAKLFLPSGGHIDYTANVY